MYVEGFFFQAEDGIRDDLVTGVQTCALPISHGDGQAEGKYWINEPMPVPNAEKAFSREATDLVGVVGDDMHLLDQLQLWYTAPDFRIDVVKLATEKLLWGLLFLQKVGPRQN